MQCTGKKYTISNQIKIDVRNNNKYMFTYFCDDGKEDRTNFRQ